MQTTAYIRALPTDRPHTGGTGSQRSQEGCFSPFSLGIRLDTSLHGGRSGPVPLSRLIWMAADSTGDPIGKVELSIGPN